MADVKKTLPERKPVHGIIGSMFRAVWLLLKDFICGIFNPKHWLKILLLVLLSTFINVARAGNSGIDLIDSIAASEIGGKILGVLSFLLFSGGGVSKNAGEIVTGTLAKTVCAAFIVSLLSGKMNGTVKGMKLIPGSLFGKHMRPTKALVGFGLALIFYAATCGNTGYAGIMVVISMLTGICKALGGNGQILRMLTASLNSYKVDKVRRVNLTNMNAMLSGGALGSVLAYAANRYCGMEGCMLIGAGIVLIGTISGFFTYAKCKAEVQA